MSTTRMQARCTRICGFGSVAACPSRPGPRWRSATCKLEPRFLLAQKRALHGSQPQAQVLQGDEIHQLVQYLDHEGLRFLRRRPRLLM